MVIVETNVFLKGPIIRNDGAHGSMSVVCVMSVVGVVLDVLLVLLLLGVGVNVTVTVTGGVGSGSVGSDHLFFTTCHDWRRR